MAIGVNLDALIRREDFEIRTEGDEAPVAQTVQIRDLEKNAFFYGALRKPDFQRETSEWDAKKVERLIQTFIDGELIPAVIFWKNKDLVFVIDGSHRLSALIAWVQDDYGDGEISRKFFDNRIPEEQQRVAQRTRTTVEKAIGSYESHKAAIENPELYGPDILSRARRLGSLALQLQWVRGDATKAEDSFVRINQQAAIITSEELELIKNRRLPNAIAARAIIRCGTGHKYWWSFKPDIQTKVETLSTEVFSLLFQPKLNYPIKTLDLPAGGTDYSSTALRMIYDLINLCVGTPSKEDDSDGLRTVEYLERTKRVIRLIISNHPSSLGLHPAVYFYSWTGKQQPILLLVITSLMMAFERKGNLKDFIYVRSAFEDFIVGYRTLINQVIRKFGSKDSGMKHLTEFYLNVLVGLDGKKSKKQIIEDLTKTGGFTFLQPDEVPYSGVSPNRFSQQVKSGIVMGELLESAVRCSICNGYVPAQAISLDHIIRRRDGGSSLAENAQVTHPYCNTGIKA